MSRSRARSALTGVIPSFFGWDTFPRATANFSIAALAVALCLWMVHQAEYLIEYGRRFDAVMESGPHALYMGQAGLALLATLVTAAAATSMVLGHLCITRGSLVHRLPARWARAVPRAGSDLRLPLAEVLGAAAIFAALQIVLYVLQENLERVSTGAPAPGMAVLWGRHITVIPLHILAATCVAYLLWVAALLLRSSRAAARLAQTFARLTAPPRPNSGPRMPDVAHRPLDGPSLGVRGARAPPLVA